MADIAQGLEAAAIAAGMGARDSIRWHPALRVDKYDDDQTGWVANRAGVAVPDGALLSRYTSPYEVVEVEGNLLTTAGLQRLTNLLIAAGGQALTNTSARIGVGNSSTAAAVGQTDLQAAAGSGNRWFQVMDATFPTAVNGVVTLKATFTTGDGNFAWNEVGTDIGTPTVTSSNAVSALMLNRFVQSLGTKVSGSWVLTESITIS